MAERFAYEQIIRESQKQRAVQEIFQAGVSAFVEGEYKPSESDSLPPEDSSFDPLIVIACVVSAPFLVRQVNSLWRDFKEPGGEVLDARNGKLQRYRLPSLDRGTLVILTDEGKAVYRLNQGEEAMAALKTVLDKLGG
jgi:hypothetical protein